LFTLPAWQMLSGWLLTIAIIIGAVSAFFVVVSGGTQWAHGRSEAPLGAWRGLSIAFGIALLMVAAKLYLGRFERLFDDHTIFAGVTYTDAHVTLTGMLIVAWALVVGAAAAFVNAVTAPRLRWLVAAVVPAVICYAVVGVMGWYVSVFIVKPNEL